MSSLQTVELGVLGPLQVRQYGLPVIIPGAKPRAILTMLGLHGGSVVSADVLVELLWGDDPPRTAAKALQTHISSLRRTLGNGFVLTEGAGWTLSTTEIDASRYKLAVRMGRDAAAAGDTSGAVSRFDEALNLWRGIPELPGGQRGASEKTRWIEGHAALVEDRADALLATGRAAEIIGELEAAVADAPLRERRWGQLMLALYRAGRQGEALAAYQRARSLLADELGVDPGPDLRRLEAAIVAQDIALELPVPQQLSTVTRAVTFLLTDIEGSTAAWEADADAMAVALARHDEIVEQVVTSRGGRLVKTRGEGDATFSVFDRPSGAAAAAIELQEAISHEPWELKDPMRIRVALHTGEVELRDGDYFGRAVNRAARLRSLAVGGQILCSGATAELVIDSLPDDVLLADLGMRQLRNLARPEHVFELRLETADDLDAVTTEAPIERPGLPAVLSGPGPFVGRGRELERLLSSWQTTLAGGMHAVLVAGEPGVGKTRLAGEWSRIAYEQGAVVIYGRCDEDLGAPYQPFAEALRSLIPCLGPTRLRKQRGIEALLPLVPGLTDVLPDLAAPPRADADTERYALFDAVVALLGAASASAPVVLILDDLHWAAKPTLLLLRHLLRFGEHVRVQIVGTYRSTDLDRSHPLAAMLADLHRDGSASRLQLSGLDEQDVTTYVAEAGYDDEELARALASVTGGNPFFLIEALRHVDESGGRWDPNTLPQGVREAVSRRLSRLPAETNKALAAAAVVGSRFALALVERVVGDDLVDAFDEACKAGIVIEEPGGRYRFNHAIVRQSLLAELASVRRMRLHQRIAATLETEPAADDERLAELAYHYFECAWAGNAAKAVDYCRRAADQGMARLAYEGAADLYDKALHALEELDEELPDRDDQQAELLVARCEALLAAGDVVSATGAVSQLQEAAGDSARLTAWGTCFDGQLSMLTDPERLDEIESAVAAAAEKLAGLDDAAGEAKAHTVRAGCLARLGRIGDCETALDQALTAARRAGEHRRVNAVLANAPLAALWGPNPVPRAGGRCLDVVRLLRITTGSPVVEATSTRCQAVLDAFRGRAAAGRQLIESARRSLTELGMRHALLEVDQFAGIVELVADDPAGAEPHLRRAYNGFRRMGLDADTAETAALLARACLALDRDAEADELCRESERLAGHALKASIAWRTVRAQLLARRGDHAEARRVAEEAVAIAERTDALVDHGDACLALATVLDAAGDAAGARAAAAQAVDLYETKGAAALAEKARRIRGKQVVPTAPTAPEAPSVELDNACVRAGERAMAAVNREDWDEYEQLFAPEVFSESRRKIVSFTSVDVPPSEYRQQNRHVLETSGVRLSQVVIAVRGERLALCRLVVGTSDVSPGAPRDEFLQLYGIDEEGRIAVLVWFDIEDLDAAIAELDAAHASFEKQPPRVPLENAASRADARFNSLFADRRWDEIGAVFTDDVRVEDRRRGVRREGNDRATMLREVRATAAVGVTTMTSEVVATRGERLALVRTLYLGEDQRPDANRTELLRIAEVDADGRTVAYVAFDLDDVAAAIEELDARFLAGEAAAHAHTWSVVAGGHTALNRHEIPATSPEWVNIDHRRRGSAFAPGDMIAFIRASWEDTPDICIYIEAVHRLADVGAIVTTATRGTSQEGFDAEWREIGVVTVDGDTISRTELFDEADLDAALARFDELSRPALQLENAASRVRDRYIEHFATRRWDAMAEMLADDFSTDDRRRVVNAGVRRGRDAEIADLRAIADVGTEAITSTAIATRGERLVLCRMRSSAGERPEAFHVEALDIVEVDADERFVAHVVFDLDDIDAGITELDARYVAGEAAPYSRIWSVIAGAFVAHNRREIPATTPDPVSVDHRRVAAFGPGEGIEFLRAGWDLDQDLILHIEKVHRMSDLGAVFTWAGHGSSQDGFAAEWRGVELMTVDGDLLNRAEIFDESDIEAALAKFEQLSRPAPRLENAASQVAQRFQRYFSAGDSDAIADLFADDYFLDDRRRTVNSGVRHGRDGAIEDVRVAVDVGLFVNLTSSVIATRGARLVLTRFRASGHDPEAIQLDLLQVVETDADDRFAAVVVFDVDDIDAAFAELDARYIAGEATAHAHTWSLVTGAYALLNRHEVPPTTPDWVNIDHRRGIAFTAGEMIPYIRATWDMAPDVKIHIEAVHRLSNLGAVVTHLAYGESQQDFYAEWRETTVLTVDGGLISRSEMFDEADLDAALARFEELHPQVRRLENAASQVGERYLARYAAGDWDAITDFLADDFSQDDRRRVVGAGVRHGLDDQVLDMQAFAELSITNVTTTVIATRGERLVLTRNGFSFRDQGSEAYVVEVIGVGEINADEKITAAVAFDPDDIDAAFEDLDARYLAGEASAHTHTWSLVTGAYATLNRHELPATSPDWVNIDHRRGTAFAPGELIAFIGASWNETPDIRIYIEAVHRLSDLGAVVTQAVYATSQEGFDAEWHEVAIVTFNGDLINRAEIYDEADVDAAVARFDELSQPVPQLENAASQVAERFLAHFAARAWYALAEMLADDFSSEDRRRVVGAGIRHGRDVEIASMRAVADLGGTNMTSTVIATRGARLILTRTRYSGRDQAPDAYRADVLAVVETDPDNRIAARVVFEPDDFEAAIEELDARYLTGEAAPHAHTWALVTAGYTSLVRREVPVAAPDYVIVDHRLRATIEARDFNAYLRASWDLTPDLRMYVEAVHRLSDLGAVVTNAAYGTSQDGFEAEWRMIELLEVGRDLINRCELFDEADIDDAIARFEQLSTPTPRLENAALRVYSRLQACFAARDWDAITNMLADDHHSDDRRRVVNEGIRHTREAEIAGMRAIANVGITNSTWVGIATRGDRLALSRTRATTGGPDAFHGEVLRIIEIDADERLVARVAFDLEDIDAAFEELDARYLAGEAAECSHTWAVIAGVYAGLNRRELPATTPDWANMDHRRGTSVAPGDLFALARAAWDVTPDIRYRIEAVHRLSSLGAVVTHASKGTSQEGFNAEWRVINLLTLEGDAINRCEMFEEADLDIALTRFDELSASTPQLENAATRTWARCADAINRRDVDGFLALGAADARWEDRRKGLRSEGQAQPNVLQALFEATAGWRLETESVAVRGSRLGLTRDMYRDTGEAERPITLEHLTLLEVGSDNIGRNLVLFDPDDINGALAELTARWIASGDVAHPEIIDSVHRLNEAANRHEWDAIATHMAGATYVNHRQLAMGGDESIADYLSSIQTLASLVPDLRSELAEVLVHSPIGLAHHTVLKGTSTDGVAFELPIVQITLLDGDNVTHVEAFDAGDRDLAVARFEELNKSS